MERKWVTLEKPPKVRIPRRDRPSFVYFIQCESTSLIKVGFASDPWQRLSSLQVGSPTRLELLAWQEGTRQDETKLHEQFAGYRVRGEWFKPGPEVMAHIAKIAL